MSPNKEKPTTPTNYKINIRTYHAKTETYWKEHSSQYTNPQGKNKNICLRKPAQEKKQRHSPEESRYPHPLSENKRNNIEREKKKTFQNTQTQKEK